jgi:hypothetical protein
VTFDHLQASYDADGLPEPWAAKFVQKHGWSLLGIVSKKHVWFREDALHDVLDALKSSGFFAGFRRVVFAGGSKGGYGALAFSSLSPGATVIAINPQSTLDIELVPWERRYPVARWTPRFRDGAEESRSAKDVFVFYDPCCEPDRMHAERLSSPNVTAFKCKYLEHGIATCFQKMGILQPVMEGAISGTLTPARFWQLYRARRKARRFARNMLDQAIRRGHFRLAEMLCRSQSEGEDKAFFRVRGAMLMAARGEVLAAQDASVVRRLAT